MAQHLSVSAHTPVQDPQTGNQHLEDVLDHLVQNAGLLLDIPSCSVALLDPETGDLETWSALNAGPDGPRHTRFHPNEGAAGWVAAHLRPLVVEDAARDTRFKPLGTTRVGSLLCVPLIDGDVLLGTLTATSPRVRAFDSRRQHLLQVFADQAVLAITKARQAVEVQKQADELAMLLEISSVLTSSLEPAAFFGHIVASIRQVAACEDAVIYAYDDHERVLRVVSGLGARVERLGAAEIAVNDPYSIAAWVAQQRRPRIMPRGPASTGEVTETFLAGDQLAMLSVPLVSKDHLRGVITIARPSNFTPTELRIMLNLANIVAAALENVELYQTARIEREQEAAIFAAGSDGIAIVDASLTIIEANHAFARLVGLPVDKVIGTHCCSALATSSGDCGLCRIGCLVASALESGTALPHVECELPVKTPMSSHSAAARGGRKVSHPLTAPADKIYVDMSVTPVTGPQGRRALLIGRDVTALKHVDFVKANFLSMMAHELRSPLQAINGYLDITLSDMAGSLTDQQREFVRRARAGGEHLKALVDDVLLMSRRDAGEFTLIREPLRLEPLIEEAHEEVELIAADAGITFTSEHQPNLPVIEADGPRVQQVLRNLLTNAIKFTPRGGAVTLSATYDDDYVRLSVGDTGIGIAADHLPRIFERFYQVQDTSARSRGQGLGLAIVRIIVEGHGGFVEVQSQPGDGSAFTVFLPRIPADPAEAGAPE